MSRVRSSWPARCPRRRGLRRRPRRRRRSAARRRGRPRPGRRGSSTATRSTCASTAGDERVRYIGVDTPETVKPGTPVQCFAQARARVQPAAASTASGCGWCSTPRRATATGGCWPTSTAPATACSSTPSWSRGGYARHADDPAQRARTPSGSARWRPRPRRGGACGSACRVIRGSLRVAMRMRQSLAELEARLRRGDRGGPRARASACGREAPSARAAAPRAGPQARLDALRLALLIAHRDGRLVTIAMFETLYYVMG